MEKERRHFIKNKLQVIQTSLEIIKDQEKNDEMTELISIMMYCVEEINRVIENNL
jgi:two-component sensor histidine kinase